MKILFNLIAAIFCSAAALLPLSATATTQSENTASKAAFAMQLASLQKEVNALKSQLYAQNKEKTSNRTEKNHLDKEKPVNNTTTSTSKTSSKSTQQMATSGRHSLSFAQDNIEYLPFDLDVPGQAFVSTGPYVGVPIQYAGGNLIVNSPSVNTDVQLLGIRKSILAQLNALVGERAKEPYNSHLLLSGLVETQAGYTNNSNKVNAGAPSTDIDLTNVSIDFTFFGPSDWLLGFIELTYDNASPSGSVFVSPSQYRVANSRIYVNKAFMTIGNFVASPFYGSAGQFYVPFGTYSSAMVSTVFTQSLTRTKARALLLGFQQQMVNALYGSVYFFRGDSHAPTINKIDNGGINLGYKFVKSWLSGNFGGGVIANIADSGGMQAGNGFHTFEQIVHRVPGYNLRGNFGLGEQVNLIAEYVGASTRFNVIDMSFNNHGAKPSAFDIEATYSFSMLDKPSSVAIGYQKSTQALSLGLPLTRYSFVLSTSWWRNTIQSLEFRRDHQYAASDVASGAGNVPSPAETGKGDNAITAQMDYYF